MAELVKSSAKTHHQSGIADSEMSASIATLLVRE